MAHTRSHARYLGGHSDHPSLLAHACGHIHVFDLAFTLLTGGACARATGLCLAA
jgi:hypothetical protein